jgi:hypothetical protein
MGIWEATGERAFRLSLTTIETDAHGVFTGTSTVECFPVLDEDGMSFTDDGLRSSTTARDATFAINPTLSVTNPAPLVARRVGAASAGFPGADSA